MRNKYSKRARISEAKIREVVRYVAADLTALQAAALSGLNRNTVNRLYRGVRERMLLACEAQRRLVGVVEVDESFFGARRVKGRRGRGRLRQDRRLRHLRAAGPRLYRDRPGLLEAHPAGNYPRPGGPAHRHQLRWLARLPRPRRSRLWPRPRRSCPRRVYERTRSYQRHRRLLGPGQSPADPIQGPAETHLPPPSQGDRMAIQPSPRRQIQMPATLPTQEPTQLGMTLCEIPVSGRRSLTLWVLSDLN